MRKPFSLREANRERRAQRDSPLAHSNWIPPSENREALVGMVQHNFGGNHGKR